MSTTPRIFRSAGLVSLGTLSSRILGLVREMLMAWTFGTTSLASVFVFAFTIPNLFRRLFGEGALSAAFVPAYVTSREEDGPAAAWALTRNLSSLVLITLGSISIAGLLGCSLAIKQGWGPDRALAVMSLLRILFPYMIGLCLAAITMGVLNSHRRYAVPAFTPCLLNLLWIGTLLVVNRQPGLSPESKILWVSWAILAAGFLQWAVQLPFVIKLGYQKPDTIQTFSPGVRRVLRRMAPAALGAAITQVHVLIDRLIAIVVSPYGPAALSRAELLIYLPLGLFATALGSILLPEFSGIVQRKDTEAEEALLDRSLRGLLFVMMPAAVGLGVLASPIVSLMFERGVFDAFSTTVTARALVCYAPGLILFSSLKIFIPLFHAHGDTRTPMRIGAWSVGINLTLNVVFISVLPEGWKHAGLALGTVGASIVQVLALAHLARRQFVPFARRPVLTALLRHSLSCLPMAAVALLLQQRLASHGGLGTFVAIVAAAGTYLLTAVVVRAPELLEIRHH